MDPDIGAEASAPSYAHGVLDPVPEIAAAALERGVRMHVDACIGGWVLPFAARLGRPVTPWTFAVEGVTSISVDLHKYAYTPKGATGIGAGHIAGAVMLRCMDASVAPARAASAG